MTFFQDNLTIKRFPSREAMGHKAAADAAARIQSRLKQQAQVNMIFAAAPLPKRVSGRPDQRHLHRLETHNMDLAADRPDDGSGTPG